MMLEILREGDQVVTQGVQQLTAGATVRLLDEVAEAGNGGGNGQRDGGSNGGGQDGGKGGDGKGAAQAGSAL